MVLYTTIPYIAEQTGVTTANIIAAIGTGSLIFSFMGPFWATKSDSMGRKRVLSIGMLGMFLSFLCFTLLFVYNHDLPIGTKIALVFGARIIYGLFASAIVPVSQAWQLDLCQTDNHLQVLTKNSICLNFGRILGPVFVLYQQVNFEAVIYAATGWVFILNIALLLLPSKYFKVQIKLPSFHLKQIIQKWSQTIRESLLPILLAFAFAAFIGILHSFLGHHLKTVLQITGTQATLLFAKIILFLSIVAIIIQQGSNVLLKSKWKLRLACGAIAIVLGSTIMMNSTSELGIFISIFFVAIATALIPPAYLLLTSRSKENHQQNNIYGKKLGLSSISHSLGYALGMSLIALSLKSKIFPESITVSTVSIAILIVAYMTIKYQNTHHKKGISQ
jgi:MFS family permease